MKCFFEIVQPFIHLLFPFTMMIFWTMGAYFNGILKLNQELTDPFFLAFIAIVGDIIARGFELITKWQFGLIKIKEKTNIDQILIKIGRAFPFETDKQKINKGLPYVLIFINSFIECGFLTLFTILSDDVNSH